MRPGPGALTLCDNAGRVFFQRVSRCDDLAAILSAYAPPAALGLPLTIM